MQTYAPVLMLLAVCLIVAIWTTALYLLLRRKSGKPARRDIVQERIRREVAEEFEQTFQQSTGPRKWWLVLRREAEIQKRASRVIHENQGP